MIAFEKIEKFDVKFDFIEGQTLPDETETIVAFHTLIQRQLLDDTLIDVANYLHVTTGPGLLLIGHQAFRSVQLDQAKAGIILSGRRFRAVPTAQPLEQHIEAAVAFGLALEAHFGHPLFNASKLQIRINDRLFTLADKGAQSLLAAINDALNAAGLDVSQLRLRDADNREQLTVDVMLRDIDGLQTLNARWKSKDQAA